MTTDLSMDSVLRQNDALATVEVDGEMVIYEPVNERFQRLDPVGTTIWHLIDGVTTLGTTCSELCEGFQAPLEVVSADVLKLAHRFLDDGLVTVVKDAEVTP